MSVHNVWIQNGLSSAVSASIITYAIQFEICMNIMDICIYMYTHVRRTHIVTPLISLRRLRAANHVRTS